MEQLLNLFICVENPDAPSAQLFIAALNLSLQVFVQSFMQQKQHLLLNVYQKHINSCLVKQTL